MFCAQNCILLIFQSFLSTRQRCINEVLVIQGPFDKIQGLFKDLSKFFNFQGVFKGLMLFQGLFKARANHGVGLANFGLSMCLDLRGSVGFFCHGILRLSNIIFNSPFKYDVN